MKTINALLFLIMLSSSVNAVADSNITLDSHGIDMCLCLDGLSNCVQRYEINNDSLQVEGTDDHTLYLTYCTEVNSTSSFREKLEYIALTPFDMFLGGTGLIVLALIMAVGVAYVIYSWST